MTVGPVQDWISDAIWSMLQSVYRQWELVIYTDGVRLEEPIPDDPRIHLCEDMQKRGRVQALRNAVKASRQETPYLGWLDADDLIGPKALLETVELLDANPASPLAVTGSTIYRERSGFWEREKALEPWAWVPGGQPLNYHFALCRRRDYDAVGGFDASRSLAMDVDLLLRLEERGPVQQAPDCSHYMWRLHRRSLGSQNRKKQAELAALVSRAALLRRNPHG